MWLVNNQIDLIPELVEELAYSGRDGCMHGTMAPSNFRTENILFSVATI